MLARVEVIVPKLDAAATFELPQFELGVPSSTWLGALNISIRNWSACRSVKRKSLMAEKSRFTCFGPIRLFRPQLPKVPGTGLVKAAGLNQPFWFGFGSTGLP